MRTILFLSILFLSTQVFSQQKKIDSVKIISIDADDFVLVEVEAKKDNNKWKEYLQENLQKVIDKASSKGMPAGNYSFNVRLLIDSNGKIAEVTIDKDPGYGVAKAIEKLFRKAPKWEPAMQNGKKVRSYHTQPINFRISN